jgi:phospholipid-translocating ATPase
VIPGTCFIRTDQLDGETDWKLRIAAPQTQSLEDISVLPFDRKITGKIHAEPPSLSIQEFTGVISWIRDDPLTVENVLWSSTVLATSEAVCCVIYTGSDTRMVMNTSKPRSKIGLLDLEINTLVKVLFVAVFLLATIMMILKGFAGPWYRYYVRFFLLFSYMIPISLRVNLDIGKIVYSWFIQKDNQIPGTVVRSSTIPEDLGRIGYLLTDKTGTLTQNVMIFKRLHLGTVSYTNENRTEISNLLDQQFKTKPTSVQENQQIPLEKPRSIVKKNEATKLSEAIKAIALCHNVTPVFEERTAARRSDELHSAPNTPRTEVSSIHTNDAFDLMELLPTKGTSSI